MLHDAIIQADHQQPDGVDVNSLGQVLWMDNFEKLELRTSDGGSEEIDTVDEVFANWNEP